MIATPLSLSAQIYDPLGSDNPYEFALNFEPQGRLSAGTVSQPNALVFLYLLNDAFLVKISITCSVKTLAPRFGFP